MGWFDSEWNELTDEERERKYIKFGFGVRDLNAENHWREAPENFSFTDKKTILVLPGSGANSTEAANGMCKVVEDMLPESVKNSWQICSMHYGNSYTIHIPTVIRAQRMFDRYFIPMIATKDNNDDLHRLPTREAMKNMRNLVVFTHCYGGYVMDEMEKQLKITMQDLGYSPEEQALISKQLFVIQHNNIEDEVESNQTATTQLLRISQDDDERCISEMKYGTFSHYMQSRDIAEDAVLYVKVTDNRRVLYTKRITNENINEHNGGYWQSKSDKSSAGIYEENVARVIFNEVVSTDYPIESIEQIIKNATDKDAKAKETLAPALESGKLLMSGYAEYSRKYNGNFSMLYDKLLNNELSKEDILMTDTDVCFVQDKENKFLMDYLLEHDRFDLAKVLFHKIAKVAIVSDYNHSLFFGRDCQNKSEAVGRVQQWAQTAINKNQHDYFAEIAGLAPRLWELDYGSADINTLKIATADVFTDKNFPGSVYEQEKYLRNFLKVYKRNEELPPSADTQTVRNSLEKFIFGKAENWTQKRFIERCQEAGLTRLVNLAQTNWSAPTYTYTRDGDSR